MIICGRYEKVGRIYRPYIAASVLSTKGKWVQYLFLIDTGADATFLHYGSIEDLGIDITQIEVKDDVGELEEAIFPILSSNLY